jgi:hypothetical protein
MFSFKGKKRPANNWTMQVLKAILPIARANLFMLIEFGFSSKADNR